MCAQAYQLADAVGAPVGLLANLAAAAAGEPIPYATFLPIGPAEVAELLRELNNPSTGREKG